MIKLFAMLTVLFVFSCHSYAAEDVISTDENNFTQLFSLSKIIRLKYRPVYALGSRPTTKDDIQKKWLYSAEINCVTNCSKSAKTLNNFFKSSILKNENCPLPIYAVIEFIDGIGKELETVSINASGRCFIFKGEVYVSENLFTMFTDDNNISLFRNTL